MSLVISSLVAALVVAGVLYAVRKRNVQRGSGRRSGGSQNQDRDSQPK